MFQLFNFTRRESIAAMFGIILDLPLMARSYVQVDGEMINSLEVSEVTWDINRENAILALNALDIVQKKDARVLLGYDDMSPDSFPKTVEERIKSEKRRERNVPKLSNGIDNTTWPAYLSIDLANIVYSLNTHSVPPPEPEYAIPNERIFRTYTDASAREKALTFAKEYRNCQHQDFERSVHNVSAVRLIEALGFSVGLYPEEKNARSETLTWLANLSTPYDWVHSTDGRTQVLNPIGAVQRALGFTGDDFAKRILELNRDEQGSALYEKRNKLVEEYRSQ